MKKVLIASMAMLASIGFAGTAFAFHGGGVAHCDGCHTMHNSQDGAAVSDFTTTIGDTGNGFLMVGSDPSSTCLTCHNGAGSATSYHVNSLDGSAYTPGGDFFWLSQDFVDGRYASKGAQHGHNTVSIDYGIAQDDKLAAGPSNGEVAYPAAALGCNSCHDPHGKIANNTNPAPIGVSGSYGGEVPTGTVAGNYRLLGGAGYDGGQQVKSMGISFADPAPVAVSPGNGWETPTKFVAYGSGMSEWCANCHTGFASDGAGDVDGGVADHRHPAGSGAALPAHVIANYDAYVSTGVMDGTTGYDILVPYEQGTAATLAASTAPASAAGGNVMCLSCHRAHATAFDDIGRWDFAEDILQKSPQLNETLYPGIAQYAYYGLDIDTRYGPSQRSLCNKCHAQD